MPDIKPQFVSKRRSYMERPVDRLPKKSIVLIVCEGEKTEPNYFRSFRIPRDSVVDVYGPGLNTLSLVKQAIRLRKQAYSEDKKKYDQVWCVFDRDDFPVELFNQAIELAENERIRIAYSNEAFELWYILHFQYLDTGITRQAYCERLGRSDCLGHPYDKGSKTIYQELYQYQDRAINYAKRLYSQYQPHNPGYDKPSTTVFELVEELRKITWQVH